MGDKACRVCVAGCVMAKSLNVIITDYTNPMSPQFDMQTSWKLSSLENFRIGDITSGVKKVYPQISGASAIRVEALERSFSHKHSKLRAHYHRNPGNFKRIMRWLSRELAKIGL